MTKSRGIGKGNNPKSRKNLKPVEPGQILNPKGMIPGTQQFKTILQKYLDKEVTVKKDGKKVKMKPTEIIALGMIKDAMDDTNSPYVRAIIRDKVIDRVDGKPMQPVENSGVIVNIIADKDELKI